MGPEHRAPTESTETPTLDVDRRRSSEQNRSRSESESRISRVKNQAESAQLTIHNLTEIPTEAHPTVHFTACSVACGPILCESVMDS
mmetsp:Transcript_43923/g.70286  ORF Transcript_43923/g.70286 Transcript_43923/m.70286 type:complete len:87 (-) Transcript_43923:438-698(-)